MSPTYIYKKAVKCRGSATDACLIAQL